MNKDLFSATTFVGLVLGLGIASSPAEAVPVAGQITPIAVYRNTDHPFGLAYDSRNNLIWYARGDSGDSLVHSLKPYKDYTAAEKAAFPVVGGVQFISLADGKNDVAGTTDPGGSGGFGSGAHFSALAYDATSGRLLQTSSGDVRAYDPLTAANQTTITGFGTGFADGLDMHGANKWFSPDAGDIYRNGALFAWAGDATKKVTTAIGGIADQSMGWSGTEQVGDSLFAVAVLNGADTGRSRTIVRFDAGTGALLGFDPDGDPVAARWEDLAYDGQYLYAADLRGNAGQVGVDGDIYVFGVTGGLQICGQPGQPACPTPEPDVLPLLAIGLLGLAATMRRKANRWGRVRLIRIE